MQRPLQNRSALIVAGFVEAARFWGGQPLVTSKAKLSHYHRLEPSAAAAPDCYTQDMGSSLESCGNVETRHRCSLSRDLAERRKPPLLSEQAAHGA